LNIREVQLPKNQKAMGAEVSLHVANQYPVNVSVPPLAFDIFVQGCGSNHILLANTATERLLISPNNDLVVNVAGVVRQVPQELLKACPKSHKTPLDALLGSYMHGGGQIFVRGGMNPAPETPDWISGLLQSVTIPLPIPQGKDMDKLLKSFNLANVHFTLPGPWAEPGSPEANPTISATVQAFVNIPKEMNFPLNVSAIRADADVSTSLGL
jgi:hypothetical protein